MNSFTSIFKTLFRIGIGFLAILIIAEIILQFLPVKTGFKRPANITTGHPPHWQPNHSFTYSSGWRMDNPRKGWINNEGYPSPHDFIDGEKAIIVIGDSFVENQMNAWEDTFMGRLHSKDTPVYAFGLSGATAADYIGMAHHVSQKYKPRHMVIVMQPGDLSGSSKPYQPGHFYIENNQIKQKPYSHKNASIRNFFKQSALIRYVMMNLQLQNKIKWSTVQAHTKKKNATPDYSDRFQFMINRLCVNAHAKNYKATLLIESKELTPKQFQSITNSCSKIQIVDVLTLKSELLKSDSALRLDYQPYDGHWNATMHGHVYEALKEKLPL